MAKAEGGASCPQCPHRSLEAQSPTDPLPPSASSLFQVAKYHYTYRLDGEGNKGEAELNLLTQKNFPDWERSTFPRRNLETHYEGGMITS